MTRRNLILIVLKDILICSVILVCVRDDWPVLGLFQFLSKTEHAISFIYTRINHRRIRYKSKYPEEYSTVDKKEVKNFQQRNPVSCGIYHPLISYLSPSKRDFNAFRAFLLSLQKTNHIQKDKLTNLYKTKTGTNFGIT